MINIEIDGIPVQAEEGEMLIQVADRAGIPIPRFCYHPKLSVVANCRMCLVEVEKAPKPLPACATAVREGMKAFTKSPLAVDAQRGTMEFLLINHPLDCPICDQGGECELQDLALGYGGDISRFHEKKRVVEDKNLGPLISTDMTRCIHCTRCVRFGEEIAGIKELGATGRGEHMEIGTYVERSVDSELSGNVIDLCPVGALTNKPFRFRARAWEMTSHASVSPHDVVGANLYLHALRGRVLRAAPRANEAVNEAWIADRDRYSIEGLYAPDRLQTPMVKRSDGSWRETDWEAALDAAVGGLRRIAEGPGPDALGGLVSPGSTVEEMYLVQALLRGLGCDNVDHRLRRTDFVDQANDPPAPLLGGSIEELERTDTALLIGCNVRKEQPLVAHRLRKAALRGGRIMLVNPVDFPSSFPVAANRVVSPGELVGELAAVAAALEVGAGVPAPLRALIEGAAVGEAHRAMAAQLRAAERGRVLLGGLAEAHPAYSTLRALAGAIARAAGVILGYLPAGANAVGGHLAGAIPHRGPGGAARGRAGLDAGAMIAEPRRGYLLLGVEPELDCADPAAASRAMSASELVVGLTPFASERAKAYASVLLPIGPFAETSGTFINGEGRWQSFAGAGRPVGETRPAWKVLRVLGNLLGLEGFDYLSSEAVRDELRGQIGPLGERSAAGGERLAEMPRTRGLERIGDLPLYAIDPLVRRAQPLQETEDGRQARLIRIHTRLAERLGLRDGDHARVRQGEGQAVLPVAVTDRVPERCVWVSSGLTETGALGGAFGEVELEKA